ncbi:MAG: dephospho-CoA kinase [bacterium]
MKIIGLTGPIASGKNEISKALRRSGAWIIDVDKVGHWISRPGTLVYRKIVKTFGKSVLAANRHLNRNRLGKLVFGHPQAMKKLGSIMHGAMVKEVKKWVRRFQGPDARGQKKVVVINAAVLHEMKLDRLCDEVWVVLASKKSRLQRLLKKGLSKKDALLRIRSQMSDKGYRKIADKIIVNDGGKVKLSAKIRAYFRL